MENNTIKEQFYTLIKAQGFESLRAFARETGIGVGNIYSNLQGRWKLSLDRAFIFANTLGVPIDTVLAIFYAEEMKQNEESIKN